jgi:hypothetical protein
MTNQHQHNPHEGHTWSEEVEILGNQLVDRVKELIQEGNVRRIIIRNVDNKILIEIPLATGVAVGGVVTIFAPILVALGAMAALVAQFKVEVVRSTHTHHDETYTSHDETNT